MQTSTSVRLGRTFVRRVRAEVFFVCLLPEGDCREEISFRQSSSLYGDGIFRSSGLFPAAHAQAKNFLSLRIPAALTTVLEFFFAADRQIAKNSCDKAAYMIELC